MSPSTSVIADVPSPGAIARVAIGDFLRRSAARGRAKTAFVLGDQSMSYGELDERVTRCANALLAAGLVRGDRVTTLCNNSLEFLVAMFGIHRAGLIWMPLCWCARSCVQPSRRSPVADGCWKARGLGLSAASLQRLLRSLPLSPRSKFMTAT